MSYFIVCTQINTIEAKVCVWNAQRSFYSSLSIFYEILLHKNESSSLVLSDGLFILNMELFYEVLDVLLMIMMDMDTSMKI